MRLAVIDRGAGVFRNLRPVHRLQEEMFCIEIREAFRHRRRLRIHQLQFVRALQVHALGALGTDGDPVESGRRFQRAVGFDRAFETARVHCIQQ